MEMLCAFGHPVQHMSQHHATMRYGFAAVVLESAGHVGYSQLLKPRWLSIISYPTRAHGIIVKYIDLLISWVNRPQLLDEMKVYLKCGL